VIDHGVSDRARTIRVEPALAEGRRNIVGGLLTPKDETGDCFKFATALAAKAKDLGAHFAYGTNIEGLDIESGRVRDVVTARETLSADAVVVALGSYSPLFLKRYGIKLPVYPVKGHSLTIPITDASRARFIDGDG
jgi:D-amino-acid dehydrogenase